LGDIAANKIKSFKAQPYCDRRAVVDDVLLEVYSRHADMSAEYVCEIMIYRKGKIAFAATEVADAHIAVGEVFQYISDMLKKAVYLSEFRLLFVMYPSVYVGDAKKLQKRLVALEDIVFCIVVGYDALTVTAFGKGAAELCLSYDSAVSRFRHAVFALAHLGYKVDLHEAFANCRNIPLGGCHGEISVKCFIVRGEGLYLDHPLALYKSCACNGFDDFLIDRL